MKLNNLLLIKKPWISEKSTDLASLRKYVFLVAPSATSHEIKGALRKIYNIHITKINIVNIKNGNKKIKRAIVTLKKGETIDITPH